MASSDAAKPDFRRIGAGARQLRARLSPEALEGLAREVVQRVPADAAMIRDIPNPGEIDRLARALIAPRADGALAVIQSLADAGVAQDTLYRTYLGAAARRLGTWWDDDKVGFSKVILGTTRIYAILRALRARRKLPTIQKTGRLLFAAVPGETHTLGITMAADLFRQSGWDVDLCLGLDHEGVLQQVDQSDCVVLGLSASGRRQLEALARLIVALRVAQPDLAIMVSGAIVADAEQVIRLLEPDEIVGDVPEALRAVQRLTSAAPDR